jgi:cysteinyl-tRNA synthetase
MKLATLLCLLSVVGSVSANEPPNAIRSCKSFAYLLQAEGLGPREQAIERLTGCDRDLIVMDYAYYGDAKSKWTRSEIERIRAARANRKVVAYLSLGEAGTYRFYWQTAWDSNKDGTPDDDAPSWLLAANPDWPDNYKVLYWDAMWQRHVLKHLDEIIAQGFDGVYLDIVDAFEFFEHDRKRDRWIDNRPNPLTGNTYREDMIAWVRTIAEHARRSNPQSLIIPQNGLQLLESKSFVKTISAVGVEDLFTHGNRLQRQQDTNYRRSFLKHADKANKSVFLIEYFRNAKARTHAIQQANSLGYPLLITDRPLKTLGQSVHGE